MSTFKLDFIEKGVIPQVVNLERECYGEEGLSEGELETYQKAKEQDWVFKGNFRRIDNKLVSYMLYAVHHHVLHVVRFCVDPEFQRKKIGHSMLTHLRLKLDEDRCSKIRMVVSDINLVGHLFLQAEGFLCVEANGVEKEWYVFEHQYVGNCV